MKNKIENRTNLKKDLFWNTLGSTLNAFTSLFYMIIITRINGINDAGIFTFAFSTATLFYMIGIYAGRVFQVTDNTNTSDRDYLSNKVICCILMLIVSIIFIVIKKYSLHKTLIISTLCFLKILEAFAEVFYAYFQKEHYLYKVGISLTLKTIISLIIFLVVDYLTKNLLLACSTLIISYLIIMIIYDLRIIKIKKIIIQKTNWNNVSQIFTKGFFTFCLSFLTMYMINIPRYAIDSQMTDEFSTIFGILIMPASVMVLLAQFVLQPFIMKLKECLDRNNLKEFSNIILKMIRVLVIFGIIALLAAYILGIPVLELLYNIELKQYKIVLLIILVGAIMYSITILLSNILISMRITFYQVLIYILNVVISYILSNILVNLSGVEGACISYCICMTICLICFTILIVLSINKRKENIKCQKLV